MPSVKLVKITGHSRGSLSVGCRTIGRNNSNQKREERTKEKAGHSRFLLVEPLLDEAEEGLWFALEQLRVIFTSEQLIVKFALHQLIIGLAPLALGPKGRLYQNW